MIAEHSGAMKVTTPSDREIVLTRDFAAPRSLVFEAFVRPEHLKRWWGRRGSSLVVCEVDLRVGGAWRFVTREPDRQENPFCGEYREITPPERLVYTFAYDVEGAREHPGLVTDVFLEQGGGTRLVETMLFPTVEERDGLLQSGMVTGAAETLDRLEELLVELAKGKGR